MDRLGLYNEALRILGERRLVSLDEDREPRRLLDDAWDANAHDSWLEEQGWNFSLRAVQIGFDPDVNPEWGYQYGFQQPEDMVRAAGIYADEYMQVPLRDYLDEGEYWFAESFPEIWVRYVSNGSSYGGNIGRWPASFAKYVAAFLAREIAPRLRNDVDLRAVEAEFRIREKHAKSKDAMKAPSKPFPRGTWVGSRLAGARRDGSFR